MSVYVHKFYVPRLLYQMDGESIETIVMGSPAVHTASADWQNHILTIRYADRDSLPEIERMLRETGFPPREMPISE